MAWVESRSLSFSARYESSQVEEAAAVLAALEVQRDDLAGLFDTLPGEVAVVLHPRPAALALAQPWLPLARRAAAPASRRYFAGWFGEQEIHVLAPPALERRASGVLESREALLRTPQHEYAHVVIGANNPELPPPFSVAAFRRYVRWAWLCEGAATWLAGQTPLLRPAIVRTAARGRAPRLPARRARRHAAGRHALRPARRRGRAARRGRAGHGGARPRAALGAGRGLRASARERGARLARVARLAHGVLSLRLGREHLDQHPHHARVELAAGAAQQLSARLAR